MMFVFYDGECGLCQRSIRFLAKADKYKVLLFAPLNGVNYKKIYGSNDSSMSTVKFYFNGETFEKSNAFFKICSTLGGIYKLFLVFKIVPLPIRDYVYDSIASQRKKISCPLLIKDQRFLD